MLLRSGPQAGWHVLVTERALAATPAGRSCGLTGLAAVAFGPDGTPLLGGSCTSARSAAIFGSDASGHWQLAGPVLAGPASTGPASTGSGQTSTAARRGTAVLALATAGGVTTAVIRTGSGRILVAWQPGGGRTSASQSGAVGGADNWTSSAPLVAGAATVESASVWPGGAVGVLFSAGRAAVVTGTGGRWQPISGLPAGTVTLAAEATGPVQALAASAGTFRAFSLVAGQWHLVQTIHVQIPYGSSG